MSAIADLAACMTGVVIPVRLPGPNSLFPTFNTRLCTAAVG